MTLFSWKKAIDPEARDAIQQRRLAESQTFLLNAAVAITDVASAITEQLKKKLEDTSAQLNVTERMIDDSLLICGMDGIVQHANAAAIRDFGAPIGESVLGLFDGLNVETPEKLFACLADETMANLLMGRNVKGETFRIEPKLEQLQWQDETASMVILIHKIAPDTLKSIIDLSFDGILVVQSDHIVAANPAINRIFGYGTADLLGKPLYSLFPNEQVEKIKDETSDRYRYVFGTHDDGRAINLVFATTGICWEGSHARVITVKPVVESDLPDRTLDLKIDNGIDMVVCFDTDDKITFANSTFARVCNRTRIELIGRSMKELMSDLEYEAFKCSKMSISLDHPSCRVQIPHYNDDGSTAVHDWIWHADFDVDGKPVEYTRTGRDISAVLSNIVTQGYF